MKAPKIAARFVRSEDGNFAMLTALAAAAIFGVVGFSINASQLIHTKSNLRAALDAAITSTARDLTTGVIREEDAKEAINNYLTANVGNGFSVNSHFWVETLTIDKTNKTVSAVAASDVDVAFPILGMGKRHKVVTDAAAVYSDSKVEVAFMLDVTGSMRENGTPKEGRVQNKLQNLQEAATDAVTNLLERNKPGVDPRVRVALIPYSQGVNAGPLSDAIWYEGDGVPKQPQTQEWLDKPENQAVKTAFHTAKNKMSDACVTERKSVIDGEEQVDTSDEGPDSVMVNRDQQLGRSQCAPPAIVPLTTDLKKLTSSIADYTPDGSTGGHIGVQWTQYLLSPKWGDFLNRTVGKKSVPGAYNSKAVKKIAILMTDGQFNTTYYGDRKHGMDERNNSKPSADTALATCAQMKNNGIEVFTIGFMLRNSEKATMAGCATPDTSGVKHFYDASNGDELKAAFNSITTNIEAVQLTN